MATESKSFGPAGTAQYVPYNTLIAQNGGVFYPGNLLFTTSGLVAIFKFYGTALTMKHGNFGISASYKVSIDGGAPTTYNGTNSGAVTITWATGLAEGWHTVKITDFNNATDPGTQGYTYWNRSTADGGDVGMTATFSSLPGGVSSAFACADGWGPYSSMSELATDLGSFANTVVPDTQYGTYAKAVEFFGNGSVQTIRVKGGGSDVGIVLYRMVPNGAGAGFPTFDTAIVSNITTVDSDGLYTLTTPADSARYLLALGISSFSAVMWSVNSRPNTAAPTGNNNLSTVFLGDSTLARGYTDGGSNPTNLGKCTPNWFYAISGCRAEGQGIDGAKTSLLTVNGTAANNSNAAMWTGRLNAAKNSVCRNVVYRCWINDVGNIQAANSNAYTVSDGYATNRLITSQTLADDMRAGFDIIWATDPAKRIFVCVHYINSSGATYDDCRAKINAMIATAQAAGKPIFSIDCSAWDTGPNAVILESGIHPVASAVGVGNDAYQFYRALYSAIYATVIDSVVIDQGDSLTLYGEQTANLTATVNASFGIPTGVTWSKISGAAGLSGNAVTAPGAGQSVKTSVIRATSNDDPTKFDEITINTPISAAGGSGGGDDVFKPTGPTTRVVLSQAWTKIVDSGTTSFVQKLSGDVRYAFKSSLPSGSDSEGLIAEDEAQTFSPSGGINVYARADSVGFDVVIAVTPCTL